MESETERLQKQNELREIIKNLGLTQAQAAEMITKETLRYVSVRTLKGWLADAKAKTASPCPLWAIKVLKKIEADKTA